MCVCGGGGGGGGASRVSLMFVLISLYLNTLTNDSCVKRPFLPYRLTTDHYLAT